MKHLKLFTTALLASFFFSCSSDEESVITQSNEEFLAPTSVEASLSGKFDIYQIYSEKTIGNGIDINGDGRHNIELIDTEILNQEFGYCIDLDAEFNTSTNQYKIYTTCDDNPDQAISESGKFNLLNNGAFINLEFNLDALDEQLNVKSKDKDIRVYKTLVGGFSLKYTYTAKDDKIYTLIFVFYSEDNSRYDPQTKEQLEILAEELRS